MNYNEQIKKLREENMLSQREFCQKIDNFVEPWALSVNRKVDQNYAFLHNQSKFQYQFYVS